MLIMTHFNIYSEEAVSYVQLYIIIILSTILRSILEEAHPIIRTIKAVPTKRCMHPLVTPTIMLGVLQS